MVSVHQSVTDIFKETIVDWTTSCSGRDNDEPLNSSIYFRSVYTAVCNVLTATYDKSLHV